MEPIWVSCCITRDFHSMIWSFLRHAATPATDPRGTAAPYTAVRRDRQQATHGPRTQPSCVRSVRRRGRSHALPALVVLVRGTRTWLAQGHKWNNGGRAIVPAAEDHRGKAPFGHAVEACSRGVSNPHE